MTANDTWFIEHFSHTGSAIGFRTTGKLDEVQSPFQKIEIYDSTDWGKLMVIDGGAGLLCVLGALCVVCSAGRCVVFYTTLCSEDTTHQLFCNLNFD